jgi:aryl carrier-like protein
MAEIRTEDLIRAVEALGKLTEQVEAIAKTQKLIADTLDPLARRVVALEERFREHGHIGDGLGSCWDGT